MNTPEDLVLLKRVRDNDLAGINYTHLFLKSRVVGDEGCTRIASALRRNRTITKITLAGNGVGEHGAARLAEPLAKNRYVTALILRGNKPFGGAAAAALGAGLRTNEILRVLDLSYCPIGDDGLAGLAQALAGNTGLRRLNLNATEAGNEGAAGIGRFAATHPALVSLSLRRNPGIEHVGASALGTALGLVTAPWTGKRYGDSWTQADATLEQLRLFPLSSDPPSPKRSVGRRRTKRRIWRFRRPEEGEGGEEKGNGTRRAARGGLPADGHRR
jgi:hypothetical protein